MHTGCYLFYTKCTANHLSGRGRICGRLRLTCTQHYKFTIRNSRLVSLVLMLRMNLFTIKLKGNNIFSIDSLIFKRVISI